MIALNGRGTVTATTDVGTAFVSLALGVAQHRPDCLHSYWGPDEWLEAIASHPPSLAALRDEAVSVATAVQNSNLPQNRLDRLQRQTRALLWLVRAQLGERVIFSEQVRLLLDVQPESVDSAAITAAQEALAAALPGAGDLTERWATWQETYTKELATILPQIEHAFTYLRQPWPQSRPPAVTVSAHLQDVVFRPGELLLPSHLPVRVDRLLHHVARWYATSAFIAATVRRYEAGETEAALWLNTGPHQVLATGLPAAILPASGLYQAMIPALLQAAGLPASPSATLRAIHTAEDALAWVDANVALMRHGEGLRPRVLRRYLMSQKLVDAATAERQLEDLADPVRAAHRFAPLIGRPLVATWLARNQTPPAALLEDPPIPSTMLFAIRFGD
ncbi:MAG: hypothetical protein RRC07_07330 [Anaerolineae bacterium]|nr:hypothetical protein [Anaerolineae bacterium]